MDFLTGLLACVLCVAVFALGVHAGAGLVLDRCDAYGRFRTNEGAMYECHKLEKDPANEAAPI